MARAKKKDKRNRGFAAKGEEGCEANHDKHPPTGIPWCEKCVKEGRCMAIMTGTP